MKAEIVLDQLLAGTLDPAAFDHRAHIAAAWAAFGRYEPFKAMHLIADGLQSLAARAGEPDRFHATVTLAFLSVIAERRAQMPTSNFNDFLAANPDLLDGRGVTGLFPAGLLDGEVARRVPVLPHAMR